MATTDPDGDTVFAALAQLVLARGAAPLTRWPDGWETTLDAAWLVALNGSGADLAFTSRLRPDGMAGRGGVTIPPYHAYIESRGWAAGFLHPLRGGTFAAGEGANLQTFYAALTAALAREWGAQSVGEGPTV
jgi:hypothetical protein